MKYTRVRAVTCAITASVMIFGTAAQTNASSVSFDLPAAGVGIVLNEGSSLASVQEEAVQSEKAAETVQEVQESPQVTPADIESGVTGVGESSIDVKVVSHVQEQQVEAAISNGVGVASVLDAAVEPEAAPATEDVVLAAGVEAAVSVQIQAVSQTEQKTIVEPVDLKDAQTARTDSNNNVSGQQAVQETNIQQTEDKKTEESAAGEKESEASSESAQESAAVPESSSSVTETPAQTGSVTGTTSEAASETASEVTSETASETTSEAASEATTESSAQPSVESTESAATESTETAQSTEAAPTESVAEVTAETAVTAEPAVEAATESAAAETPAQTVSSSGSAVADYALQFVGNPYVYGGTSLTNGADCSGFVMSVYQNFGISLPHSSSADRSVGVDVGGLENAQPGDIVCYSGHVGIYIGNGQIVHASTASTGIKVSDADYRTPVAVRRVLN